MLRKIGISQLRIGMFVDGVEGSWLKHAMWKTRFPVDSDRVVASVRGSGVQELWIDTERGVDVDDGTKVRVEAIAPVSPPEPAPAPQPPQPVPLAEELQAAREIQQRARVAVTSVFQEVRMGRAVDPEVCAPLVAEIVDSVHRNNDALVSLSRLKLADEYTYLHSVAVCALMVMVGKELGFSEAQCHEAGMAGLMHDLGKAVMPMDIINKPGSLTDAEFEVIRSHPVRGFEMLRDSGVTNEAVLGVCRSHHERMAGDGYPDRIPADQLPVVVRIGAVCDVYDAITSNRPYKAGWDPAESIARMASWKGHFDPDVLRAFIKSLGIYPTGSLVRLSNGQLAVVVAQNPAHPAAPQVRAIFSVSANAQIPPHTLDLARRDCNVKITSREAPENWPFIDVNKHWMQDEGR